MTRDLPLQTAQRLTRENVPESWVRHGRAAREKFMAMNLSIMKKEDVTLPGPEWVHRWQDQVSWQLPMRNETAISLRGLSAPPFAPVCSGWGLVPRCAPVLAALAGLLWLLFLGTGWNVRHILFSCYRFTGPPALSPTDPDAQESAWSALTPGEQCLLVQIAVERIANPHLPDVVHSLVGKGWLALTPEISPASAQIEKFLLDPARQNALQYEQIMDTATGQHSWRSVRFSLVSGVGIAVLFLFSTQPALPVDFLGLLTVVSGSLGAAVKLMDRIAGWLSPAANDPA